jgi:hypothetical protein
MDEYFHSIVKGYPRVLGVWKDLKLFRTFVILAIFLLKTLLYYDDILAGILQSTCKAF